MQGCRERERERDATLPFFLSERGRQIERKREKKKASERERTREKCSEQA